MVGRGTGKHIADRRIKLCCVVNCVGRHSVDCVVASNFMVSSNERIWWLRFTAEGVMAAFLISVTVVVTAVAVTAEWGGCRREIYNCWRGNHWPD